MIDLLSGASALLAQSEPNMFEPLQRGIFRNIGQSSKAGDSDQLFMGIFWLSVAFFVVLMTLMVYWVIKYRRKPGKIAPVSASHNTPLEVAWTVIPLAILIFIFFKGFHGYLNHMVAPGNAIEMNLTAKKWVWSITYPNGALPDEFTKQVQVYGEDSPRTIGTDENPIFYMPAETPVKFIMSSQDVIHSFWIPDFRVKLDVFPNRFTSIWFEANSPDGSTRLPDNHPALPGAQYEDHWVFCAEYCGDKHSEMVAVIRVVSRPDWDKYMAYLASGGGKSPAERGQLVARSQGCLSCHSIDGSKNTGPTWKGVWGTEVPFEDGGSAKYDENYVRESVLQPAKHIHKGYPNQMVSYQGKITDDQLNAVIAYIKSLTPGAGGDPTAAPADAAPEAKPAADAQAAPASK